MEQKGSVEQRGCILWSEKAVQSRAVECCVSCDTEGCCIFLKGGEVRILGAGSGIASHRG